MRAVVLLASLSLLPLGACARSSPQAGGDAVDDVLMAYLSTARVLHHEADLAEDRGDVPGAITALDRLIARPETRRAPEIDEVIADTHARLADLRSRTGDPRAAMRHVELGLTRMPEVSYYRGHLFEMRGLVEERTAKDLAARGDTAGAASARERAMKAYEEAIAVQEQVIVRGAAREARDADARGDAR
jgi:hypothetical protein